MALTQDDFDELIELWVNAYRERAIAYLHQSNTRNRLASAVNPDKTAYFIYQDKIRKIVPIEKEHAPFFYELDEQKTAVLRHIEGWQVQDYGKCLIELKPIDVSEYAKRLNEFSHTNYEIPNKYKKANDPKLAISFLLKHHPSYYQQLCQHPNAALIFLSILICAVLAVTIHWLFMPLTLPFVYSLWKDLKTPSHQEAFTEKWINNDINNDNDSEFQEALAALENF